jgi:hypothetical protein
MTRTARLKRGLTGLAIGATVFGGVYGFAASLNVTSDSLGAGSTAVAACQPGTVNVSYATGYAAGSSFSTTIVTLNNIDTALCGGKAVSVVLSGAGGAVLAQASGVVLNTGTTYAVSLPASAASVVGVHAVISG